MKLDGRTIPERIARSRFLWLVCLLAGAGLAAGVFIPRTIPGTDDATAIDVVHRIHEHGRLSLELADLPSRGALHLELMIDESPDASHTRSARIVSADGRRLDTPARRMPGANSVIRLGIDSSFLSKGLYLIQLGAEDGHPLNLRRFVLEIR